MLDKETLMSIAKIKGLTNKEQIEKDYFQDLFLLNLSKKTNGLVFKGGTALYKLYKLPRFSEDLDFSYLDKEIDIEKVIRESAESIRGFKLKEIKRTKGAWLAKISIEGILTSYNTIRIDVSSDSPVERGFDVKNYTSDYLDVNPFSIRVLTVPEILAEKVHAVFARDKARDIFDLFFLVKLAEIDLKLIDKKLEPLNNKFDIDKFEGRIKKVGEVWESELKPFVLSELPDFKSVRELIIEKFKEVV